MQDNPYLGTLAEACPELDALPAECFDELPQTEDMGEVAARQDGGNTVPVSPNACPLCKDMLHYGPQPLCASPSQGLACTEFFGTTDRGTVRCAALHTEHRERQPFVALIALQKREKLPPPHILN
jgi:hypothetical protein